MSFLGDDLNFETFVGKDFLKGLKKDPKRLLLGVDPLSTKAWNAVLHRHDEPLVDQLGGAYGGSTISAFGNNKGGVYKRAQDAGINTGAGEKMQDAAHVVAAIFGGQGLGNAGSNIFSSNPQGNLGFFSNGGKAGLQGLGGGNAGALASSGGISGGSGLGTAGTAAGPGEVSLGGMNWQQFGKQGLGGNNSQQQQQKNTALQDELDRQKREEAIKRQIAAELSKAGLDPNTSFPVYA